MVLIRVVKIVSVPLREFELRFSMPYISQWKNNCFLSGRKQGFQTGFGLWYHLISQNSVCSCDSYEKASHVKWMNGCLKILSTKCSQYMRLCENCES